MFDKILIANRGEIACRVIKTAKRLGITTVAVYSDADCNAQHVRLADEAYAIGPAPSQDSYLNIHKIIAVAKQSQAQAIHPGYGFLSENAQFANACADNNIVFIGPPASAIEAMGSKSAAKTIMDKAKVPLTPGYHGDKQDLKTLTQEAKKIGYPILIKASAGGGGKGMRAVYQEKDFEAELASAKREAKSSFNDDHVLLEKYLENPRHIEVQVFADSHGNVVHCFERDCSIQRRHQKVIEEAPAPGMTDALRQSMTQAAINAAKAINYIGAGTVEFLLNDDNQFYFMEMNTRLQVEHPITEMITHLDLVEWQLRVACGEPLPLAQSDIKIQGHAIEARLYAEDPNNQFLPATGHLDYLKFAEESQHVRIDSGVVQDDSISPYYDPMIAKLIAWDKTRDAAVRQMHTALQQSHISGLKSNKLFLQNIAAHKAFKDAQLSTQFIPNYVDDLLQPLPIDKDLAHCLAAFYIVQRDAHQSRMQAKQSADFVSPWAASDGWRMNLAKARPIEFRYDEQIVNVSVVANHYHINGSIFHITGSVHEKQMRVNVEQHGSLKLIVVQRKHHLELLGENYFFATEEYHAIEAYEHQDEASGTLIAPMPGTISAVFTEAGKSVASGDSLMVIEAMKMEHTIKAPIDGVIESIFFAAGDLVDEGAKLLSITEAQPS